MSRFIVDDKIYDTEKANKLAEGERKWKEYNWVFGKVIYPSRETALYKTAKGAFFFTGKYDYEVLRIEVTTETQAKDFLKYNNYEKYVELYGELEEA